jgi:tRNA A-37 threonylcarbamoyl transferase component Bud32
MATDRCDSSRKPNDARIRELTARIEKRSTKAAVAKASVNKEFVMRELVENLETHKGRNGAVVNRALELIGKELGMFRDDQPRKPMTLEDLSTEDLRKLLDDAVAPADAGPDAGPPVQ